MTLYASAAATVELSVAEDDVCMCFHEPPLPIITKEDWDARPDGLSKAFAYGVTQFIATNKHCYVVPCVGPPNEVELFMLYTTLLRTEGTLPPYRVKEGNTDSDKLFFVFFTKMDVTVSGTYSLQRRLVRFDKPKAKHSATVLNAAMDMYMHAITCGANTAEAAKAAANAALVAGGESIWTGMLEMYDD